jgi:hypothetical protein
MLRAVLLTRPWANLFDISSSVGRWAEFGFSNCTFGVQLISPSNYPSQTTLSTRNRLASVNAPPPSKDAITGLELQEITIMLGT